jgi:hypothetical protein
MSYLDSNVRIVEKNYSITVTNIWTAGAALRLPGQTTEVAGVAMVDQWILIHPVYRAGIWPPCGVKREVDILQHPERKRIVLSVPLVCVVHSAGYEYNIQCHHI